LLFVFAYLKQSILRFKTICFMVLSVLKVFLRNTASFIYKFPLRNSLSSNGLIPKQSAIYSAMMCTLRSASMLGVKYSVGV